MSKSNRRQFFLLAILFASVACYSIQDNFMDDLAVEVFDTDKRGHLLDLTDATFEREIDSELILVLFYSSSGSFYLMRFYNQ